MGKKKKAAIQAAILLSICGLIIWHVIHWHSTGMYSEMFNWLKTGRAFITVLYNLGLMLVLGVLLAFLMEKIANLIGYEGNTNNK